MLLKPGPEGDAFLERLCRAEHLVPDVILSDVGRVSGAGDCAVQHFPAGSLVDVKLEKFILTLGLRHPDICRARVAIHVHVVAENVVDGVVPPIAQRGRAVRQFGLRAEKAKGTREHLRGSVDRGTRRQQSRVLAGSRDIDVSGHFFGVDELRPGIEHVLPRERHRAGLAHLGHRRRQAGTGNARLVARETPEIDVRQVDRQLSV